VSISATIDYVQFIPQKSIFLCRSELAITDFSQLIYFYWDLAFRKIWFMLDSWFVLLVDERRLRKSNIEGTSGSCVLRFLAYFDPLVRYVCYFIIITIISVSNSFAEMYFEIISFQIIWYFILASPRYWSQRRVAVLIIYIWISDLLYKVNKIALLTLWMVPICLTRIVIIYLNVDVS